MKNKNTEKFIEALEQDREGMIEKRNNMTEIQFGNIYGISPCTVCKYMGYADKTKMRKVILDPEEINKLRRTMTDKDIRIKFNTSINNINATCGSREKLGIPKFINYDKKGVVDEIVDEIKIIEFDHDYWKVGEIVEIGTKAIPFTYEKIK